MTGDCDILILGGGFYGCMIATHLRRRYPRVRLVERSSALLGRASFANQARVHQGYHYPRSLITGFRSRANYARFTAAFPDCVHATFHKVYAIGREHSKVSAAQFELFCRRIGAPISRAPASVAKLFDSRNVEAVFTVEEAAFNSVALRDQMQRELTAAQVDVELETEAVRIEPVTDGLRVTVRGTDGERSITANQVFNCTYSQLNQIAVASGLPVLPLKHEIAEMALVRVPDELRNLGVTVMCGPFFSTMPFPSAGLHTLSHVRYTPHASWTDPHPTGRTPQDVFASAPKQTAFERMQRDSARYLPAIAKVEYVRSLWEVKTVLPVNEADDGRPILFRENAGLPGYHLVLGAKIDNIFDILERIDQTATALNPIPQVA